MKRLMGGYGSRLLLFLGLVIAVCGVVGAQSAQAAMPAVGVVAATALVSGVLTNVGYPVFTERSPS